MKTAKSASKIKATEQKLIRLHANEYSKMLSIGFTHSQAVNRIRESHSMDSIGILTALYNKNIRTPGSTGFRMTGIKKTPEVQMFIKEKGLTLRAGTLYFPRRTSLGRIGERETFTLRGEDLPKY